MRAGGRVEGPGEVGAWQTDPAPPPRADRSPSGVSCSRPRPMAHRGSAGQCPLTAMIYGMWQGERGLGAGGCRRETFWVLGFAFCPCHSHTNGIIVSFLNILHVYLTGKLCITNQTFKPLTCRSVMLNVTINYPLNLVFVPDRAVNKNCIVSQSTSKLATQKFL